jgi:hypothetical protein
MDVEQRLLPVSVIAREVMTKMTNVQLDELTNLEAAEELVVEMVDVATQTNDRHILSYLLEVVVGRMTRSRIQDFATAILPVPTKYKVVIALLYGTVYLIQQRTET